MNPTGRPRLSPPDRRTVTVKVYLTDKEFARLNREAHALGMGMSGYVRALLLRSIEQKAAA